jgi:hypothetical protein
MYKLFLVYGSLILGLFAFADYRGLSLTNYDEVKNVPKSIRNNPGAYRSMYQRYYHK